MRGTHARAHDRRDGQYFRRLYGKGIGPRLRSIPPEQGEQAREAAARGAAPHGRYQESGGREGRVARTRLRQRRPVPRLQARTCRGRFGALRRHHGSVRPHQQLFGLPEAILEPPGHRGNPSRKPLLGIREAEDRLRKGADRKGREALLPIHAGFRVASVRPATDLPGG